MIAPHPLAPPALRRVPRAAQRSCSATPGEGFKLAMRTLDIFRTSVAAASLGFARRAMAEGARARRIAQDVRPDARRLSADAGKARRRWRSTIDSAALLVYRAAWLRDQGKPVTREAAMAKWHASEGAQQVIDAAVQLWGGRGVQSGSVVEQLYREIRALRIYEGATEVQQLIVGRDLLKTHATQASVMTRFERRVRIRFSHCDPAGIVFFPQYLVMTNVLVEDWFNESLDIDYAR